MVISSQAKQLSQSGMNVVVFNPRGNEIPQQTTNIFDYSKTLGDLKEVMTMLEVRHQNSNFYIAGTSLGASLGIKYLANYNDSKRVKGMVSFGNPFDVYKAAKNANSLQNIVYGKFLTNKLIEKAMFNKKSLDEWQIKNQRKIDYKKLKRSFTTFQFDQNFSFKILENHNKSENYYLEFSCFYDLEKVNEPVLFIQSKNDPISSFFYKN